VVPSSQSAVVDQQSFRSLKHGVWKQMVCAWSPPEGLPTGAVAWEGLDEQSKCGADGGVNIRSPSARQ
jgi:hypothetical protein